MTFHVGDHNKPGPPTEKQEYERLFLNKSHVTCLNVMKVDTLSVHPSKPNHLMWTGLAEQSTVVLKHNNHFNTMQVGFKEVLVELSTPFNQLWMSPNRIHAFNLGGLSSCFSPCPPTALGPLLHLPYYHKPQASLCLPELFTLVLSNVDVLCTKGSQFLSISPPSKQVTIASTVHGTFACVCFSRSAL
jgi:hypothetical protein